MWSERSGTRQQEASSEPFHYASTGNGAVGVAEEVPDWSLQSPGLRALAEQREKEALQRGVQVGETRARGELATQAAEQRAAIGMALEAFKAERADYFARIEPEVVHLSLAIARKILHREAQLDPLLLAGMVHVALEKLERGTHIRLRAHPEDVHFWIAHFAKDGAEGRVLPELVGDAHLKRGECALETEMGSTSISLETHLKEIEQGFLDLLEQRPQVR